MNRRVLRLPGILLLVSASLACATGRAARHWSAPASEERARALAAWNTAVARADSLSASRLLYDAHMASGGAPAVPGTLAVTYDGQSVVIASLTGPFGSRVAEYRSGAVTGEDRKALVVDPAALRAVLAGAWSRGAPSVGGCDGADCRLDWTGGDVRVAAVLDVAAARLLSMDLSGPAGRLSVDYSGEAEPWPARVAVRDDSSGRHLNLKLVAVEPMAGGTSGR